MTKQTHFQPETLTLRWPIKDDKGNDITTLTLGAIYHGDHAEVLAGDPEEREAFAQFARLSCGLSANEVKHLKMPDWNALRLKLSDLVAKGSDFFFKRAGVAIDTDKPLLLIPIQGDDGRTIEAVELQVPSVETTDLMQKQPNAEARSQFITMSCTGLSHDELNRLSAPDWNYLQGRINDFLNETADYFPAGTSTS